MSSAENAVLAMSRSMHGKRLTKADFERMLALKSANEIGAYLKSTSYADGFEGITSGVFNAKSLQVVVDRSNFNKVARLCKLEYIIGQSFYRYFVTRIEIEQILRCTSFILGGEKDEYMLDFCGSIERELTVDLYKLAAANSLSEIADVLKDTQYGAVYRRCLNDPESHYLNFETAFDSYFRKCAEKMLTSLGKGKNKQAVYECICHHNHILLIEILARSLLHYKNHDTVRSAIIPTEMTLLGPKQLEALTECESLSQMDEILSKTVYRDVARLSEQRDIKCYLNTYLQSYYSKQIRFSSCPAVVVYCFMCSLRIEGSDVIKLIQANRYSLPAEKTRQCICSVEFMKEKEEI